MKRSESFENIVLRYRKRIVQLIALLVGETIMLVVLFQALLLIGDTCNVLIQILQDIKLLNSSLLDYVVYSNPNYVKVLKELSWRTQLVSLGIALSFIASVGITAYLLYLVRKQEIRMRRRSAVYIT